MSDSCCRHCGGEELGCATCASARLKGEVTKLAEEHKRSLDAVYDERNRCVAAMTCMAMTRGWMTWLRRDEKAGEPNWTNVVFIDLPTGQVSWHISDSDLWLFEHLPVASSTPVVEGDVTKWDGHTTEEKYQRLERLAEPMKKFPWLFRP